MRGSGISSLTSPPCLYTLLNEQLQRHVQELIPLLFVLEVSGHMHQRIHNWLVDVAKSTHKEHVRKFQLETPAVLVHRTLTVETTDLLLTSKQVQMSPAFWKWYVPFLWSQSIV